MGESRADSCASKSSGAAKESASFARTKELLGDAFEQTMFRTDLDCTRLAREGTQTVIRSSPIASARPGMGASA